MPCDKTQENILEILHEIGFEGKPIANTGIIATIIMRKIPKKRFEIDLLNELKYVDTKEPVDLSKQDTKIIRRKSDGRNLL
jgi:metal-dependent amidase/aminoacylase/carboxypeptidase family protein